MSYLFIRLEYICFFLFFCASSLTVNRENSSNYTSNSGEFANHQENEDFPNPGSDDLGKLHSEFLSVIRNRPLEIVNFVETLPTPVKSMKLSLIFVPQESGDPGVGEVHHIAGNHSDICKPLSKQSFVYQRIVKLLKGISEDANAIVRRLVPEVEPSYSPNSVKRVIVIYN